MDQENVIVINAWQEYLCYWRSETPRFKTEMGFPNWPNSYVNVKKWSAQLESWLKQENISFTVVDRYSLLR